jgi:nicotinate phosphoribosyltransferase
MKMIILNGGVHKDDKPIIDSRLDLDFYKITMGQFIFLFYRTLEVVFGFKNRTKKIKLPQHIDIGQLRENLDHVMTLQPTKKEISFLDGLRLSDRKTFKPEYLNFFGKSRLPQYELKIGEDGELDIRFPGSWAESTYWETQCMSIITELFTWSQMKNLAQGERKRIVNEAEAKLRAKIKRLNKVLNAKVITEFGTRRRAFKVFQRRVIDILRTEGEKIYAGTSNVMFSMEDGTDPKGTFAHEIYMALAALMGMLDDDEGLKNSHNEVLKKWWELYGRDLSIALTDTFGTGFFFQDMTCEQAGEWKGLRHDSGDAIIFGEKAIEFYNDHCVDPAKKIVLFSDGLDDDEIVRIFTHFAGRLISLFGWGTTLTNDLGFPNLSIIVKVLMAGGRGTVKLSDNIAKAMGSENDIARYKRVFGYNVDYFKECKV